MRVDPPVLSDRRRPEESTLDCAVRAEPLVKKSTERASSGVG